MRPALLAALLAASMALSAAAGARPRHEFPVLVWRERYAGREVPASLLAPFGGTNVEGSESAEWVLERGLDFYVGHAPGRDALHIDDDRPWYAEAWRRFFADRDASALVRRPCLSEPRTLADLEAQLARTVRARGGRFGLGMSLGDEVGLTAHGSPLDLCHSPACLAAWRRFAAREAPARGLAVPPGGAPYVETDEVRRRWLDGDPSLVPWWLLRRRFHQAVLQEVLARLARRARALAPGVPVGLVGVGGRSAFGDVAVEEVLAHLDFIEVYPQADARELAATLRRPNQNLWRTVFPEHSPEAVVWQAFDHWRRGGDALVVWSDAVLEDRPALAARLAEAIAAIRALRGDLGAFRPRPAGVALIHAPDSLALAWLRDALADGSTWPRRFAGYHEQHGTRERALRGWLRLFEDLGTFPGAVLLRGIGASTARRFPLLVASHVAVLSPADLGRLGDYLAAGGRLVVDGPFGEFDRAGRSPRTPPLATLDRAAPGRVEQAPLDPARYLEARRRPGGPAARRARARAADLLARAGVMPPPGTGAERGAGPLLAVAAQRSGTDGAWTIVLQPNAADAGERERLVPWRAEIAPPEGARIEWLHPPGARGLAPLVPAGEAAVLRLTPPAARDR